MNGELADWEYSGTLDTQGLMCPEPIMLLHKAIKTVAVGECLYLMATDPATLRDVPKFCRFLQHELVAQIEEPEPEQYHYLIRRNS